MLVVREETDGKRAGELTAVYAGEFDRPTHEGASGSRNPAKALILADAVQLNLKGQTEQVSPLDLSDRPDLQRTLEQAGERLSA
jgi:hypothetical protein